MIMARCGSLNVDARVRKLNREDEERVEEGLERRYGLRI